MNEYAAKVEYSKSYTLNTCHLPDIFCWTKIGVEAGQTLDSIIRRKELERRAGNGFFAWGIGNSLGLAINQAYTSYSSDIDVLFTPIKSHYKKIDATPNKILLWQSFINEHNEVVALPEHILVTSRDNPGKKTKKFHYALLCYSNESIDEHGDIGELYSNCARNFSTSNRVGHSQVTSLVRYDSSCSDNIRTKEYKIAFSAKLIKEGFVRLCSPIALTSQSLDLYNEVCNQSSPAHWLEAVVNLKHTVSKLKKLFYCTSHSNDRSLFA